VGYWNKLHDLKKKKAKEIHKQKGNKQTSFSYFEKIIVIFKTIDLFAHSNHLQITFQYFTFKQ
jgi:hypothetical protein